MFKKLLVSSLALLVLTACGTTAKDSKEDKVIKVASHMEPMTTVVTIAGEVLAKDGYTVELVPVSDNAAANIALNNKEIDANFFQHVPFMTMFNAANNGTLVGVQPIYDAIVGFYSKTVSDIKDLPVDAKIAIPNDQVNQARALMMLEAAGLINLNGKTHDATLKDVAATSYQFIEVDLLTLTQAYDEVDLVYNYPTYIKALGLTPKQDALILETSGSTHYAISLVAREDNKDSEKINKLKEAMTSKEVKDFLTNEENSKTLAPAF
ncbi:MetQ/NlpA family ABC transporter substrate-binding protein [Erysipelothrix anatis]|uniref:MetQ/NlpA family ABC transporter substrate-binding protein n=1 Tax=Erysipelothrix anatis TaxID=2683713 RepID=UPI00135BD6C5|nr:MetQ/NlpA family ABC transporter substrate-binding protein [Erysipelothrix anatis]